MSEETKKKRKIILTVISIVILAIAVGYMIYSMLFVRVINGTYRFVLAGGIFLFWLIEDVIKPYCLDAFADKTPEQKKSYYVYAAMSLAGYAGLVYYALCMEKQTGIYGVLVYAGTVFAKRKLYEDFKGESGDEEDMDDSDTAVDAAQISEAGMIAEEQEAADTAEDEMVADEQETAYTDEAADEESNAG